MLALWLVVAALSVDPKQLKWRPERPVGRDGRLRAGKRLLDEYDDYSKCYDRELANSTHEKDIAYVSGYCVCKTMPDNCKVYQDKCKGYYENAGNVQKNMTDDEKDSADPFCKGVCSAFRSRPRWCPLSTGATVGIMTATVVVSAVIALLLIGFLVVKKKGGQWTKYNG
jgi:hypothetical protein